MPSKLKPGVAETVLAIPAAEINGTVYGLFPTAGAVAMTALTDTALNEYLSVTSLGSNGARGGNITCAIQDDMTLGLTGSETDDSRTLCTVGQSATIKRFNFEAAITYRRDSSLTSTSSDFVLMHSLFRAPDVPYIIAHRMGYPSTTSFADGQKVSFYYVHTDFPVAVIEDDEFISETQTFIPKGVLAWEQAAV